MTKYYVMEVDDESAAEYPDKYGEGNNPHPAANIRIFMKENNKFPEKFPPMEIEIYDDPKHNKLNDFIHSPVEKYCVSERVKNLLCDFNLPDHRFYPVTIYRPKKLFYGAITLYRRKLRDKYYAFNYSLGQINDLSHFIDFTKTNIIAKTRAETKIKMDVNTWQEYKNIHEKNGTFLKELEKYTDVNGLPLKDCSEIVKGIERQIYSDWQTDEIVINKDFDHTLDLFELPIHLSWQTYVSERLMKALKEMKATGLIFSKINERQYRVPRPNPKLTWL